MISYSSILHRKKSQKMTWKVQILQTMRRLFIILLGLTMTWFSGKMLIFKICRYGLMPNLITKSLKVSSAEPMSHSVVVSKAIHYFVYLIQRIKYFIGTHKSLCHQLLKVVAPLQTQSH